MRTASPEPAGNDGPVNSMPMPLAGATAPVTLAGTLAMLYAEFLSGVVLYQLARPGLPVTLGIGATILDMRTGLYAAGAPELYKGRSPNRFRCWPPDSGRSSISR